MSAARITYTAGIVVKKQQPVIYRQIPFLLILLANYVSGRQQGAVDTSIHSSELTSYITTVLFQCLASVLDGGPTLKQHSVSMY